MMTTIYTDLAARIAVRVRQTSCCCCLERGRGWDTHTRTRRPQHAPKVSQNERTRHILATGTNSFLFLQACTSLLNTFCGTLTQSRKATHHSRSPSEGAGMQGGGIR